MSKWTPHVDFILFLENNTSIDSGFSWTVSLSATVHLVESTLCLTIGLCSIDLDTTAPPVYAIHTKTLTPLHNPFASELSCQTGRHPNSKTWPVCVLHGTLASYSPYRRRKPRANAWPISHIYPICTPHPCSSITNPLHNIITYQPGILVPITPINRKTSQSCRNSEYKSLQYRDREKKKKRKRKRKEKEKFWFPTLLCVSGEKTSSFDGRIDTIMFCITWWSITIVTSKPYFLNDARDGVGISQVDDFEKVYNKSKTFTG